MKKVSPCLFGAFLLTLYGCSTESISTPPRNTITPSSAMRTSEPVQKNNDEEIISVSQEQINKIHISDYFPLQLGTIRIYQSEDNGKPLGESKQTIKYYGNSFFHDTSKPLTFAIVSENTIGDAHVSILEVYEVTKDSITQTHHEDTALNVNNDRKIYELSNQARWKVDEETQGYVTAIDQEVTTLAGTFLHCLEVTEVITVKDNAKTYIKKYYAPRIGLVMTKLKIDNEYTVVEQLTDFRTPNKNMPPMKTNSETNNNEFSNNKYGFRFTIPVDWREHYVVEEGTWTEYQTIEFNFKTNGHIYTDSIMTIYVSNKSKAEIDKENENAPFPMAYIASKDGLSFTYQYNIGDPSSELAANANDLELLTTIKESVPNAISSFSFDAKTDATNHP